MNSCTCIAPTSHLRVDVCCVDLAIAAKSSIGGEPPRLEGEALRVRDRVGPPGGGRGRVHRAEVGGALDEGLVELPSQIEDAFGHGGLRSAPMCECCVEVLVRAQRRGEVDGI